MNVTENDSYQAVNCTGDLPSPNTGISMSTKIGIMIVSTFIITIGILGNTGVLLVVTRVRDMRTPMYFCLASLSVSDILVLIILPVIPLAELLHGYNTNLGKGICYVSSVFDRGSVVCSVFIVLFISIERYIAVCYPLKAARIITVKVTVVGLAIIWVCSYGINMAFVDMTIYSQCSDAETVQEECYLYAGKAWFDPYITMVTCAFFFLPIVLLICLNVLIIRKVTWNPPAETASDEGTAGVRRSRRQAVLMLAIVVLLFLLCIAPMHAFALVEIYVPELLEDIDYETFNAILWFGRVMMYINSAANPIIYNLVSTKFRESMKIALGCNSSHSTDRNGTMSTQNTRVSFSHSSII